MSNKKKQKYYAIKIGKDVNNKIVRSWNECKKIVLGYPSVYKSFKTEEEAVLYLDNVEVDKIKQKMKVNTVQAELKVDVYIKFNGYCKKVNI